VPALETVRVWHVVADPAAIDGVRVPGGSDDQLILRIAPDEALFIDVQGVEVPDPHAVVEFDTGWRCARLGHGSLATIERHIEGLSPRRPSLAQGKVAGVPAKVWVFADEADPTGDRVTGVLLVNAAYARELEERLGWR